MTAPSNEDLRDACDAIQEDMAEHQRRFAREPTPAANHKLAAETFEQLERQLCEAPTSPQAPAPTAAADPVQERRIAGKGRTLQGSGNEYTVSRDFGRDYKVGGPMVPLALTEKELVVKALRRLHKLLELEDTGPLGQPSYKQRAVAVMAHYQSSPLRFAQELDDLLEASIKHFGDWRTEPEPKIFVGA